MTNVKSRDYAANKYFNGGSATEVALAAVASFGGSWLGDKVADRLLKQIAGGIDAPAKILHEVASGLTAAQRIALAQVISSVLGVTLDEVMRLIQGEKGGC